MMVSSFNAAFWTCPSILINTVLSCLIVFICFCGDKLTNDQKVHNIFHRIIVDSFTHGFVGGLCWAIVESQMLLSSLKSWINCMVCIMLAMFVDVDHFIAAGVFDLKKATTLPTRPPFHNTTIIFIVVSFCWLLHHKIDILFKFALMFLTSWLSHHLRDANRRGLWIYPFGHTPPLSFPVYVNSTLFLALLVRLISTHHCLSSRLKSDSINV